ncbi:MAG TPA: FtsX-like permease family protein [Thermoleophilaceae bacterium]|nr:FtsX-like permease family protein [Thermoleophilaceae bacterium]
MLAFAAAGVLAMAGGMLLDAALRTHPPVERYAAAAAVVTGQQMVGADHDVPLPERARVSSTLVDRLAAVRGVRAAIADVSAPALLAGRPAEAHGWSSARLAPYVLTAGRAPARPNEVVAGYPARLGAHLTLSSTERAHKVTVVGVAHARHVVHTRVVFLTDDEVARLAGHAGEVDAIGLLAGNGFNVDRVRAVVHGADVLTGPARGRAEAPEIQAGKTRLIAISASFAGLGIFVALFVVAGTMSLSIQQREQEIALLRAVAATPGQIRRMIAWEATLVAIVGSAAGIWPGERLGQALADGLVRHGLAPQDFAVKTGGLPAAGVIVGGVTVALLAVWAASRRAARVAPTRALAEASVEPRGVGWGRLIGGLVALAGAIPLFAVASTTTAPATAAPTSELTAIFLVIAAGCLGPIVARLVAAMLAPVLAAVSPVGGFLASANLGASARRFSSASTPLVLTVALSTTLLFSTTTIDHAVSQQRHDGLSADVVVQRGGGGLPPAALADVAATRGVASAVALTPTALGPSLGVSDDVVPAQVVTGTPGRALDVGVLAGSLDALRGNAIALGRHRADSAHARVGDRVSVMLGDGARAHPRVVAIYKRELGFGEALLAPELAEAHTTDRLVGPILVDAHRPGAAAAQLRRLASEYPGLHVRDRASLGSVDDPDREANRWLGPLFVVIIFAFTSIAVVNTLVMIGLRRGRELGLLRLSGATKRQVRSMARWEATLIVAIGLGVGLAIAATALVPLSHALTGGLKPFIPVGQLTAILGVSALLAVVALALPTRRALRSRPIDAVASGADA